MTLVSILRDLLRSPSSDIDAGVELALGQLCPVLGGGRAWLFTADSAGGLQNTHASADEPLARGDVLPADAAFAAPWLEALGQGRPVVVPDISALPEGLQMRHLLQERGAKACVLVPSTDEAGLQGFICAECTADPQAVTEECLLLLGQIAELMHSLLQRRENERQQQETANRLRAMLAALPDLLFEVDANGRFTGFYAGPRSLMVRDPEELTGLRLSDVLPPDVARLTERALREVLERGRVADVVYPLDLPDGTHVFDLIGSRKPPAEPGQPATAVFLIREVTNTTRMQEELRRLGSVMQAISNLVVIMDTGLRITWANPAFERHTGWMLDEIRGQPLADLVRCPESDPEVVACVSEAIAQAKPFAGQMINRDRHGNRYWVEFNIVPLYGPDGQLQGYASVETVVTRLKEQEAALGALAATAAAAQIRLENAINALPDSVLVFDADERLIVRNPAYGEAFPQLADQAVPGALLADLLREGARQGLFPAPDDAAVLDAWVEDRLEQYRQERYVDEVQMPDGRWVRRVNNRTSDGGLIALGIDTTARRNQIAALDEANRELTAALAERDQARQRLLNIIDGAQVGTWEWDVQTARVTIGGQWLHIIGREDEGLEVVPIGFFRDLLHPDDLAYLDAENITTGETDRSTFENEFRMRHRDGRWVWVLSRGRVTRRDISGRPIRIVGVHLDISERRRLETEIRESESYLTSAMESSVAAIAIFDAEGVEYCNHEAERILRLTRTGTGSGRRFRQPPWVLETLDGKMLPASEMPCPRALAEGATVRDIRFALHWPDGARRVLTCNATPLTIQGDERRVVVSFWDITDHLAATERLEQALAHAEEMSRSKSIFLANMSHEIRTPLNGVLGMAEVLGMQLEDPEHQRMITTIRQSGETLLTVLNSILDMSKIEAGKMELEAVPIVLNDIVAQIDAVYSIQAEEKGIEFEVLSSTGCECPRLGDPHRVQQILHNLLNNAIKFTAEGSVTLKASCRPGKPLVFEVRDTGVGMTADQAARVFDSFEQADGSMTRRFGGTGLGLSIVRQLVALMGGEVALDSAPGQGTTVRVTLPLPEAEMAVVAPPPRPADPQVAAVSLGGLRILSADDSATNREVLGRMLEPSGAQIRQAENGQEALDLWLAAHAAGTPFDIALLDITMPVRDGLSAITEIRRIEAERGYPMMPAVAVTANAMPDQVAEYVMRGFDTHLAKPFNKRDLMHSVTSLVRVSVGV